MFAYRIASYGIESNRIIITAIMRITIQYLIGKQTTKKYQFRANQIDNRINCEKR